VNRVVYADGPAAARTSPHAALAAAGLSGPVEVLLGFTVEPHAWLDDPVLTGSTVISGYALAPAVAAGRITPLPVRLSAMPNYLDERPADVAVVAAVPRGSGWAFNGSVGWGDAAARTAERVVIEADRVGVDLGGPAVEGNIVVAIDRPAPPPGRSFGSRRADDVDLRIGRSVAALLPDDATLQFGLGGIGAAIASSIERPVRIWSGMVTESVADLHRRGLLLAPAVTAYTWGGEPIERLASAGMLELTSTAVTHDLTRISSIPRFVACNTALQVGLDGSVNVERVGGRSVAAVGGHSDFCVGASRSAGGLAVIALRSTTVRGESTIVPRVDVVTTQRSDIDVVVTEYGVARVGGVSDAERAARLVAVAAPEHRDELRSALA
jgi:acyl-CoA hydrolase